MSNLSGHTVTSSLPFDCDVLVVGAGPVGLSLAVELGMQGMRCIVIEAQNRDSLAPRAKTTNVRSRELMRRWGIAESLAAEAPFGIHYPSNVVFATRLLGTELARFPNAFSCSPERDDRFAEHAQWVPQYKVEKVLRRHALSFAGVSILQPVRLAAFVQDEDGVSATIQSELETNGRTIRARYLVGADGARSTVRAILGVAMDGQSPLGQHRAFIFRSPGLDRRHTLGPAIMFWIVHGQFPSVIAPLDQGDLWTFGLPRALAETTDPITAIRQAVGADIPVELLSTDDWTAHQLIAQHYRVGRVFLAGDACHLHPPFGGHGMNMGIGDAVDLGWKLAATLQGWGGAGLLDSYEVERRQVHQRVVNEAVSNHKLLSASYFAPGLDTRDAEGDALRAKTREAILRGKTPEFRSLGVVIGYHYEHSPVIARDPSDTDPLEPRADYVPNARPGCRAPHVWLADGKARGASLYDHIAFNGLTLLATRPGATAGAAIEACQHAARSAGIPLSIIAPQHAEIQSLYQADFVLLRPDHHVAWRGNDIASAARALMCAAGHSSSHPH